MPYGFAANGRRAATALVQSARLTRLSAVDELSESQTAGGCRDRQGLHADRQKGFAGNSEEARIRIAP